MRSDRGRVLVAGSANMDVVGLVDRHPQLGETVTGRSLGFFPGGKGANQAVAAARMRVPTRFIGCLGGDGFGDRLERFLLDEGVVLSVRRIPDTATGTALIVVDQPGENTIVIVPGANGAVDSADIDAVDPSAEDVLVSPFEIPLSTIARFFRRGREAGATTILNPAPALEAPADLFDLADVIVLNETELAFFAKTEPPLSGDEAILERAAHRLQSRATQSVVVTLGKNGALALTPEGRFRIPGLPAEVVDTTGAGDCFTGVLAAAVASGRPLSYALETANRAASLCVQRPGAGPSMPTRAEVDGAG